MERFLRPALLLGLLWTPWTCAVASDSEAASPVRVIEAAEVERLFESPETRAVVLIFVLPDCPISNSYAPEYTRLHEEFASRGAPVVLVHVDAEMTVSQVREHAKEYRLKAPVHFDPQHVWVKKAGATRTPEAAVFSPRGELLYRGRIDDRYVGIGRRRPQARSQDLKNALEAVLKGETVTNSRTDAIGCPIPGLKKD